MANILHSAKNAKFMTPRWILEAVRATDPKGHIDLDPCSTKLANKRVEAAHFFNRRDNGLVQLWRGFTVAGQPTRTAFVNPPGGIIPYRGRKRVSSAAAWFHKALLETISGRVDTVLFLAFSLELFKSAQLLCPIGPFMFPFWVPSERIAFDDKNGTAQSPTHANAVICLSRSPERIAAFVHAFKELRRGDVRYGMRTDSAVARAWLKREQAHYGTDYNFTPECVPLRDEKRKRLLKKVARVMIGGDDVGEVELDEPRAKKSRRK